MLMAQAYKFRYRKNRMSSVNDIGGILILIVAVSE